MLTVGKVVEGASSVGDAGALQPAAALSPEIRTQLFDEFQSVGSVEADPATGLKMATTAFLLALVLGLLTLYIVRHVAKEKADN